MIISNIRLNIIQRSKRLSATETSARQSADYISDDRTGATFDYSGRPGVVYAAIILPDDVFAPWTIERSELWNEAEAAEARTGCSARECVVMFERGLSVDVLIRATRDFSMYIADRDACAIDYAIHEKNRVFHAHILMSSRWISNEGFGRRISFKDKKADLVEVFERIIKKHLGSKMG